MKEKFTEMINSHIPAHAVSLWYLHAMVGQGLVNEGDTTLPCLVEIGMFDADMTQKSWWGGDREGCIG